MYTWRYLHVLWQSTRGLVDDALAEDDLDTARRQLARIVSRDTAQLEEAEIAAACCETVLENGSDGIFAALFWFCLPTWCSGGNLMAGLYGIVLYRSINTLDAMWGYKNERYYRFGWAAARLDDVANYVPARLVALAYGLAGSLRQALHCAWGQGLRWKSSNAGVVMAAGAGSLNIRLGGAAVYGHGREERPPLGCGRQAVRRDIERALALINRSLCLWLLGITVLSGQLSS